jgi:hypothetical protein
MDLTSLLNGETSSGSPVIQKDIDPAKFDAIAAKLCDRRSDIEQKIRTTEGFEREELAIRLLELKKDMSLFGISEIDYQAYIAQKARDQEQGVKPEATIQAVPQETNIGADMEEDYFRD